MSMPEYQGQFYIPADGISREVITTDICRYLGNNARISRPNMDAKGKIIGYWYCAYRAFTDAMVRSLQEDSVKWQREKDRNYSQGLGETTYESSSSRPSHSYYPEPPVQPQIQAPMPMAQPPSLAPIQGKSDSDRYVYDAKGNAVYDLKYKMYLTQPPPVPTATRNEDTPRVYATQPPPPPTHPAPASSSGYWAIDPTTGQQYYVVDRDGRGVKWGP